MTSRLRSALAPLAFLLVCLQTPAQQGSGPASGPSAPSMSGGPRQAQPTLTPPQPSDVQHESTSTATAPAVTRVAADPQAAVKLVTSLFMPNSAVNVSATGKPLPMTGTWGAQVNFPAGLPKSCVLARVPCVRVVYRVPDANVTCSWIVGFLTLLKPLPGPGHEMTHVTTALVLDEDEAAAHYTIKKGWAEGETRPRPVQFVRAEYPQIAAQSNIGGTVTVRLTVGPDGVVSHVEVLDGPALLKPPVVAAVKQWKFEPFAIGAAPTTFSADERFSFNAATPTLGGEYQGGSVVFSQLDPHKDPGFETDGATTGRWESCTAVTCQSAAPDVPK